MSEFDEITNIEGSLPTDGDVTSAENTDAVSSMSEANTVEDHTEVPSADVKPVNEAKPTTQSAKPVSEPAAEASDDTKPTNNTDDKPSKPAQSPKKKGTKEDKKKQSAERKERAKLKKEWEDSIVASKRVKREEIRRKFKHATVILLVFALVVTSVVYVMLLFMQENNVRITASNRGQDASISLSMDNKMWTPYLNASGPSDIWNISYSPEYNLEKVDTVADVRNLLNASSVSVGEMNGKNFIRFVFMVKNSGKYDANLSYEMTLEYDKHGLQNSVRVMWGESYKSDELQGEEVLNTSVDVYAARTNNPRLAGTNINIENSPEDGYIEYVAYPEETLDESYKLTDYESQFTNPAIYEEAVANGYFATTPFLNDNFVFQRHSTLPVGEIMYCYVCIWVEGSDFDCKDSALGGYVKMGINFVAY